MQRGPLLHLLQGGGRYIVPEPLSQHYRYAEGERPTGGSDGGLTGVTQWFIRVWKEALTELARTESDGTPTG